MAQGVQLGVEARELVRKEEGGPTDGHEGGRWLGRGHQWSERRGWLGTGREGSRKRSMGGWSGLGGNDRDGDGGNNGRGGRKRRGRRVGSGSGEGGEAERAADEWSSGSSIGMGGAKVGGTEEAKETIGRVARRGEVGGGGRKRMGWLVRTRKPAGCGGGVDSSS